MKTPVSALPLLLALLLAACGPGAGSSAVGGECTTDHDCDALCTMERAFGTGMCTRACTTDQDCPVGAVCAEKAGGLCAVSCTGAADCTDFGRGFTCGSLKRKSGGEAAVCRIP